MLNFLSSSLVATLLLCGPAYAATVYSEAVSGDLSSSGLSPTALAFAPGSNQLFGTTGRGSAGVDRDYFTMTVPTGYQIGQIIELAGTQVGDNVSFIGLEPGPRVTVLPSATTADGLLGWTHYGPVSADTDILPAMALSNTGSSGFSALPAGQYSFWIQDFAAGSFSYAFDVRLTPTPEPGTYASTILGLVALACVKSKWLARKRSRARVS